MRTHNKVNMMIKLILAFVLVTAAFGLFAQDNNSAAAYIRMGIGARVIAMGEAGTALTNDITSAYWNPAGLANMKDIEFSSMYFVNMGYDRNYKYAALGKRYSFGSLAINWINASTDDIEGFDENDQPTGFFNHNEHNIGLSYAHRFKRLHYGATTKLYLSIMEEESKSGLGIDLGAKYDINQYVVAGVMLRDLYGKVGEDKIPYQFSAGLTAYPFIGITLSADAIQESKEKIVPAFGAEYWTSILRDNEADSKLSVITVAERASWKDLVYSAQTGVRVGFNDGRFSVGSGVRLRNLQLDYVYRIGNHDIFNDDHIISMILRF